MMIIMIMIVIVVVIIMIRQPARQDQHDLGPGEERAALQTQPARRPEVRYIQNSLLMEYLNIEFDSLLEHYNTWRAGLFRPSQRGAFQSRNEMRFVSRRSSCILGSSRWSGSHCHGTKFPNIYLKRNNNDNNNNKYIYIYIHYDNTL